MRESPKKQLLSFGKPVHKFIGKTPKELYSTTKSTLLIFSTKPKFKF